MADITKTSEQSLNKILNNEISFLTIFFLMFSLLTLSEMLQAKTDGALFLTITLCNLIIYEISL